MLLRLGIRQRHGWESKAHKVVHKMKFSGDTEVQKINNEKQALRNGREQRLYKRVKQKVSISLPSSDNQKTL